MVRRLLILSGIAILGVILFHSAGWGFVAMFAWQDHYAAATGNPPDRIGGAEYYLLRFIEQLTVFVIPAFLFVSGFFIAAATGRSLPNVKWSVLLSRIKHLVVPYLIWSAVLIVLLVLQGRIFSPAEYLRMLLTGSTNPAYYYVPLLCQLLLLSPLMVPAARSHWMTLLIVTAVIQISVQLLYYPALIGTSLPGMEWSGVAIPKWAFPTRIFWFAFGIVVGFHTHAFRASIARWKWILLMASIALVPLGIFEWEWMVRASGTDWLGHRETLLDTLYSGVTILAFLAFADVSIPFSAFLSVLAAHSFGIYLIHSPVMEYISRILYHVAPEVLGHQILLQPLLWIFGLGVPLALMAVVRRSPLSNYYRWFFG